MSLAPLNTGMRIFILEDSPLRMEFFRQYLQGTEIHHAPDFVRADTLLRSNVYDVLFLDHDLDETGINCGSGSDVVDLIGLLNTFKQYPSQSARHIIHSMNPQGAAYMFEALRRENLQVSCAPEIWSNLRALQDVLFALPANNPLPTLNWEE